MLKLYQRETCPYCKPVRELLTELNITYINANVPKERERRTKLIGLTGVPYIPAIKDGEVVIAGKLESNEHILEYILNKYNK